MKNKKIIATLILFGSFFLLSSCAQTPIVYNSPKGYDFNNGQQIFLPDELHELSGLAFDREDNSIIYANEDENGIVYFFSPTNPKNIQKIKFGKKGDYEGIAISEKNIVVLESQGTIHTFPLADIGNQKTTGTKITQNLIPKGEYESLAISPIDNSLYVICKKCKEDKDTQSTSGYILDLSNDGEVSYRNSFKIDEQQINNLVSLKRKRFRPSALAYNVRSDQWFILDSINKILVLTNDQWQVIEVYSLNSSLFNQPEAMAFDKNNNLYIGNEGGDVTKKGTIIKFNFNN